MNGATKKDSFNLKKNFNFNEKFKIKILRR